LGPFPEGPGGPGGRGGPGGPGGPRGPRGPWGKWLRPREFPPPPNALAEFEEFALDLECVSLLSLLVIISPSSTSPSSLSAASCLLVTTGGGSFAFSPVNILKYFLFLPSHSNTQPSGVSSTRQNCERRSEIF
jgi:hypothetical protein